MDGNTLTVFLTLVFGAVFVLAQTIFVPSFGTGKQESKRLRKRLGTIMEDVWPRASPSRWSARSI